jgi:hypothetical protein
LISGDLAEGTEVVTGVAGAGDTTRPAPAAGGLFMPGGAASGRRGG